MRRTLSVVLLVAGIIGIGANPAGAVVGLCQAFKSWNVPNDTLTAADLNSSFTQAATNNLIPSCIASDEQSIAGMQLSQDPYPAGAESLATSLKDEIERIRYVLQKGFGFTQWYKYTDPLVLPSTLGAASGGTGIASYTIGDMLYASGTTTLSKLADVAAGSYLRSGGVGAAPLWSTLTLPNAATANQVVYATGPNAWGASANLTFDATTLTLTGQATFTGSTATGQTLIAQGVTTNVTNFFNTSPVSGPHFASVFQITGSSGAGAASYKVAVYGVAESGSRGDDAIGGNFVAQWDAMHTASNIFPLELDLNNNNADVTPTTTPLVSGLYIASTGAKHPRSAINIAANNSTVNAWRKGIEIPLSAVTETGIELGALGSTLTGDIVAQQPANGADTVQMFRFTDTAPTGNFLKFLSANLGTTEFLVDVSGNVTAAGGVVVGAPTGGNKGAGTVNATGYYQNGTALASLTTVAGTLVGTLNGTDYSTTSASFSDVDATNLKVTVTVPTGAQFLSVHASFCTENGLIVDGANHVQILADGVAIAPGAYLNNGSGSYGGPYTVYGVLANPTAGAGKTIALQFSGDGNVAHPFLIRNQAYESPAVPASAACVPRMIYDIR